MIAQAETFLRIEFGDQFISRIRIVDVVVGKLFTLQLLCRRDAVAFLACCVERRFLMWVFAVA